MWIFNSTCGDLSKHQFMGIQLRQPYKIIERRRKRYEEHYHIPSEKCVIIPLKEYGDDISCDVHWEDANGVMQRQSQLFFHHDNLEPLDSIKDFQLHEIWQHYYKEEVKINNN
jgi:hypothetical protein